VVRLQEIVLKHREFAPFQRNSAFVSTWLAALMPDSKRTILFPVNKSERGIRIASHLILQEN
jgi:hypothetical protein